MAETIVALQGDGETVDRIAELCGTTTAEIRRLRRLVADTDADTTAEADTQQTAGPAEPSAVAALAS